MVIKQYICYVGLNEERGYIPAYSWSCLRTEGERNGRESGRKTGRKEERKEGRKEGREVKLIITINLVS